ncbi:MAG TPA: transporter [Anaeromyxobacter sp.]|nr:transporter [Anaeromyxobacter sp.]
MRSHLLVPLALAAATLLPAARARACSVCAAGDPLVAAGDAAPEGRELRTALEAEWLTAEAEMAEMPGMIEEVDQATLRALAVFSPLARLNAVLAVPLVQKSVSATGAGMDHGTTELTGLGDVELGARWFVLDETSFAQMRHHSVALSAGTSFPTGDDDATRDGVRLDQHSQIGTGGWGPYAGVMYRLEQSRWHAFASLTGRWRSENAHGYRYGASLHWSLTAQRDLADGRVAVGLGIDGRQAAYDREHGEDVAHTGGLVLAAAPEAHVQVRGSWWLTARAQLPFATSLHGNQDVGPTVSAGVQFRAF